MSAHSGPDYADADDGPLLARWGWWPLAWMAAGAGLWAGLAWALGLLIGWRM